MASANTPIVFTWLSSSLHFLVTVSRFGKWSIEVKCIDLHLMLSSPNYAPIGGGYVIFLIKPDIWPIVDLLSMFSTLSLGNPKMEATFLIPLLFKEICTIFLS